VDDQSGPKRGNPNWVKGRTPPGAKPFQKGISGNPRGGSHRGRLANLLFQQLNEMVEGDPKQRTAAELVVRALIKEAIKGNVRAAEICLERVDGKMPLAVNVMTREEAAERLGEMLGVDPQSLLE
jgi:uncharacterized protein DUF5681